MNFKTSMRLPPPPKRQIYAQGAVKIYREPGPGFQGGGQDFFYERKKGASTFFDLKKGGHKLFFHEKKGGASIFPLKIRRAYIFFFRKNGGPILFLQKKKGASIYFTKNFGGQQLFLMLKRGGGLGWVLYVNEVPHLRDQNLSEVSTIGTRIQVKSQGCPRGDGRHQS